MLCTNVTSGAIKKTTMADRLRSPKLLSKNKGSSGDFCCVPGCSNSRGGCKRAGKQAISTLTCLVQTHLIKSKQFVSNFYLNQVIEEPTHYTERSSSLLDIILTNNNDHLLTSGVGDPFLQQDRRYHCPTYGILQFVKTKTKIICAPDLDLWTRWQ